ncbi:MAG TPA: hypothetical protein VE593_08700, partial [Nitrososphaeraceae archaeon]|nr:hypothetical protein [Nitrososphaeraceae archaeon]
MDTMANKQELFDTANAKRLASKGDMLPHYNSTRGVTLFRIGNRDNYEEDNFFFLQWSNWQNEQSHVISCSEDQAFQFLYDLYGSRYTDITDEELDDMLHEYFPNRTIAGIKEEQEQREEAEQQYD